MRIILAEDEAAIRTLLSRGLKRCGATVAECDSVSATLEAALDGFDAAILDANLPDGSGLDAAAHLAGANPAAQFVICSGYPVAIPDIGLDPAVAVAVLQKPFRIGQLLEILGLKPTSV